MNDPYQPPTQPVSLDKVEWGAPPPAWPSAPQAAQQQAGAAGATPPAGYTVPPAGHGTPPQGYGAPPAGHGVPPVGHVMPPGSLPLGGWAPVPYQRQPEVVPSWALASPWTRLGASLLNGLLMIVTLFVGYLVWALVLWNEGTNPGKKMLGLAVVKADTGRLCTFGDMAVRNLVFGGLVMWLANLTTLGIAWLVDALMVFGDRRQRGIDKLAGTLVVVVRR